MNFILNLIKSIVFGIVEGITEWLPISSTAHLILLEKLMPLSVFEDTMTNQSFFEMYKIVIQFASILAVVVMYFSQLNPFDSKIDEEKQSMIKKLWVMILIACIPAAVLGFILDDFIEANLSTPIVIAAALIVYGIAFIVIEMRKRYVFIKRTEQIEPMDALKIGLFQILSLIPGTSRSGATILGGCMIGFSRPLAAKFSFFVAIPVMLGASLLKLFKLKITMNLKGVVILAAGMVTAFIVSIIAIKRLITYILDHDFKVFGYYRVVLGLVVLAASLLGLVS